MKEEPSPGTVQQRMGHRPFGEAGAVVAGFQFDVAPGGGAQGAGGLHAGSAGNEVLAGLQVQLTGAGDAQVVAGSQAHAIAPSIQPVGARSPRAFSQVKSPESLRRRFVVEREVVSIILADERLGHFAPNPDTRLLPGREFTGHAGNVRAHCGDESVVVGGG
jgi:hypothetical protein